jgi:hypothetical protein
MGERVESSVGVPMASVVEGWRPLGCLRHEQPVSTRKSLLVDNLAMAALAVGLWRRALMPALSAGLRLSRDCRTLVIKARLSSPSIQVELDEVSASRWY